MEMKAFEDCPE